MIISQLLHMPIRTKRILDCGYFINAAYRLPDTENSLQMELYSLFKVQLYPPLLRLLIWVFAKGDEHVTPKPKIKHKKVWSLGFHL